jgi:hypothetical protein
MVEKPSRQGLLPTSKKNIKVSKRSMKSGTTSRRSKMETIPWVPPGVEPFETTRKLLGVLVPKGVKVGPQNYPAFHEDKRRLLVEKAEDPAQAVLTYLDLALPGYPRVEPSREDLLAELEQEDRWLRPGSLARDLLAGSLDLKELKSRLRAGSPQSRKVSQNRLKKELEELSLEEYLELVA